MVHARKGLSGEDQSRVLGHVAGCETCERAVDEAVRSWLGDDQTSTLGHGPGGRATLERGRQVGRYLVVDLFGMGGMGEVHSAVDPELGRKVALKLVKGSSNQPSAQARLLREAHAMAKLSHPNVVAIYDVGAVDGRVFLAMELVEGVTLTAWQRTKLRRWREVIAAFVDAGRGLAAAHQAGMIHRDFKPDNILVGADGRVRVSDFGLVRTAGDDRSRWHKTRALKAAASTRRGRDGV